jgi:hypothetical protein
MNQFYFPILLLKPLKRSSNFVGVIMAAFREIEEAIEMLINNTLTKLERNYLNTDQYLLFDVVLFA